MSERVVELLEKVLLELIQLNARVSRIEDGEAAVAVRVENTVTVEVNGAVETWSGR